MKNMKWISAYIWIPPPFISVSSVRIFFSIELSPKKDNTQQKTNSTENFLYEMWNKLHSNQIIINGTNMTGNGNLHVCILFRRAFRFFFTPSLFGMNMAYFFVLKHNTLMRCFFVSHNGRCCWNECGILKKRWFFSQVNAIALKSRLI